MGSDDSRKQPRRKNERRHTERRKITEPFGSPEWLEAVQKDYYMWPKYDRRHNDRRSHERRQNPRRQRNIPHKLPAMLLQPSLDSLLTEEEKQMLNDLSQQD